jgi:hypothetical protein
MILLLLLSQLNAKQKIGRPVTRKTFFMGLMLIINLKFEHEV